MPRETGVAGNLRSKSDDRYLLRLEEAAYRLSMSTRKLREFIQRGEVRRVRWGENAPWLVYWEDCKELAKRYTETLNNT